MPEYQSPARASTRKLQRKQIYLIASGDLRSSANQKCWPAQSQMEATLAAAVADQGYEIVRGHAYREADGHGFIDSQKYGMAVFKDLDPKAPLIVAESVWQYSH